MMSLEILMIKISLLTEKANVTKMQPKKVRQLWRIIFRTEKQKKWVSLNISLIFLPAWTDYHLNHLSYYSKESTFEVKIALSLQEAMDIIKQPEIKNTVRFSIYSSTREFGSTGQRFHYKVSVISFNKRILICCKFCIDGPSSCRTTDTLSQFNVPIESLTLGVLMPRII